MEVFWEMNMWWKSNKVANNPHWLLFQALRFILLCHTLWIIQTAGQRTFSPYLSLFTQNPQAKVLATFRCVQHTCAFLCMSIKPRNREGEFQFEFQWVSGNVFISEQPLWNVKHTSHLSHVSASVSLSLSSLLYVMCHSFLFAPLLTTSLYSSPFPSFTVNKPYENWVRLLRLVT